MESVMQTKNKGITAFAFAFFISSVTSLVVALERYARREILAIGLDKDGNVQIIAAAKGILARVVDKVTIALGAMNPKKFLYVSYVAHNKETGQTLLIADSEIDHTNMIRLAGQISAYLMAKLMNGTKTVADLYLATAQNFKGTALLVDTNGNVIYAGNAFEHLRMLTTNNTVLGIKEDSLWAREQDGNWKCLKSFGAPVTSVDRIHTNNDTEEWTTVYFNDGTMERIAFNMNGQNIVATSMDAKAISIADSMLEHFMTVPAAMVTGPNNDYVAGVIYEGSTPTVTYLGPNTLGKVNTETFGLNAPYDPEDGDYSQLADAAAAG
ncbi:MAG TPA: hypothetical protein DEF59_02300 [Candidatus Magasanikbacteria bacterium]|nr:hypothetical protein [Candidatus Magasanikbacteria bacterium]